jgi:hypothetical protein
MIKPTFIIAGPPKAGTSSLQHYIDVHPEIFIPDGEAHFFCEHYNEISYYADFFKKWSGQKAIGEKTPCYFYKPEIPKRIKSHIPNVKLLFIYRNPIDRAYSQYWHNVRRAVEDMSFEEAVKREITGDKRVLDDRVQSFYDKEPGLFSYVAIGRYAEHIKRWREYFDNSQMFHVVLEDISHVVLHNILRFLDVDDNFSFGELKKFNVGGSPRSTWLTKSTRRFENIKIFHDAVDRLLNFKRGEYPKINPKTRKYLEDYFNPYNEEFGRLTNLSLEKWKS